MTDSESMLYAAAARPPAAAIVVNKGLRKGLLPEEPLPPPPPAPDEPPRPAFATASFALVCLALADAFLRSFEEKNWPPPPAPAPPPDPARFGIFEVGGTVVADDCPLAPLSLVPTFFAEAWRDLRAAETVAEVACILSDAQLAGVRSLHASTSSVLCSLALKRDSLPRGCTSPIFLPALLS